LPVSIAFSMAACAGTASSPEPLPHLDPTREDDTARFPVGVEPSEPGRVVLKVGESRDLGEAAAGSITAPDGTKVEIRSLFADTNLVIVFFRGHWCSKCRKQLSELQIVVAGFGQRGANVIAISTDSPEQNVELMKKLRLTYKLYDDDGGFTATLWGVYSREHDLARPSVFVVAAGGNIAYRYVSDTPSDRPTTDQLLEVVESLRPPQ